MRARLLRPGLPPVTLLLALLLSAALGSILDCHAGTDGHRVHPAAVAEPAGAAAAEPAAALLSAVPPARWDPCTSDHPCQHGPADGGVNAPVVRGPDLPRTSEPAASSPCPWPPRAEPQAGAVVLDGGPAAAALAPLAVLCVDRN